APARARRRRARRRPSGPRSITRTAGCRRRRAASAGSPPPSAPPRRSTPPPSRAPSRPTGQAAAQPAAPAVVSRSRASTVPTPPRTRRNIATGVALPRARSGAAGAQGGQRRLQIAGPLLHLGERLPDPVGVARRGRPLEQLDRLTAQEPGLVEVAAGELDLGHQPVGDAG